MKLLNYVQFIAESSQEVPLHAYHIPTYDECVEICSKNDAFYESKFTIENYKVSMFNYRLAKYSDFITPLPEKPNISGKELRGLTFVFNEDGSIFERYILLEKFFNLNQVPESMYSVVSNFKIKQINNKEDGSIASFIRLPNGNVYGKSKMSFESEQANQITQIYKINPDIRKFVDWCIDSNIIAIFEYVGPSNRIVIQYWTSELILLRLRDNKTGKHLDIKSYLNEIGSIKIAPFEDERNIDELIEISKSETNKEGWVIQATDDSGNDIFWKQKTNWYCALHGLVTDKINRENEVIELILDDQIDDVIAQIPENDERIDRIYSIVDLVSKEISLISHKVSELKSHYTGDRKNFAIKYHKSPYFSIVMGMLDGRDEIDLIKKDIRQDTSNLMMARKWVDERLS